jgi:hypothetical protein
MANNGSRIEIQNDVPMPQHFKDGGRPSGYPWATLEVGQSFLFPAHIKSNNAYTQARVASLKNKPKLFRTSRTSEGYRCWRIA